MWQALQTFESASGVDVQKVFCQPEARCGEIRQPPSSFAERHAALGNRGIVKQLPSSADSRTPPSQLRGLRIALTFSASAAGENGFSM
jgi:hypothetical protein